MANHKRPMTSKEAWRVFESAMKDVNSIEEAAKWLRKNEKVAKKMTGMGLLGCFEEDVKTKK